MTSALLHWINQLVPSLYNPRSDQPNRYPVNDVTHMALDLSMAEDIVEALQHTVRCFHQQISHELNGELFLIGPAEAGYPFLYHESVSPSPGFEGQLRYQLTKQRSCQSDKLRYRLPGNGLSVYSCQIQYAESAPPAWLTLSFKDAIPEQQLIDRVTETLVRSLTLGLQGWFMQQQKLIDAIEHERSNFAAELHDSTAQVLGYLRIRTSRLDELCKQQSITELQEISADLVTQTSSAYQQTRELIASARLTVPKGQLISEIQNALQEFEQRSTIVFEFDNRAGPRVITPDDAQLLFIIREALCNIVRHSRASHARIRFETDPDTNLKVLIEDNGIGFASPGRPDSFGLNIMRERAEKVGASLIIVPRQNGGTRVELYLQEVTC